MTEAKTTAKPKTGKPPAAKAEEPKKAAAAPKKETAAKAAVKKTVPAGGEIKLTQIQGTIARRWDQQATLVGLGLGKRHRTRILKDTPEVRGMINKVQHLVKVEKA